MQDFPDLLLLGEYTNNISQSAVTIDEVDFDHEFVYYRYETDFRNQPFRNHCNFPDMEGYMNRERWVKT